MISFDIFDTLITRTTANPIGVFYVMENRLKNNKQFSKYPQYFCENFARIRINAEQLARNTFINGVKEDITFEEIYKVIASLNGLKDEQIKELMDLEIELEYDCSIAIQKNISYVKELIQEGEKVVLISDMYHSQDVIRKLLVKSDEMFQNIKIYVSSEFEKVKATGNLFWLVKEKENIDFVDWMHIGDNNHGDVVAPQRLGIKVKRYVYEELMPIEKCVLHKNEGNYMAQLIIGAAKNARINNVLTNEMVYGITLGGPLFVQYVIWMIERAKENGIKKLYFIARDGYVLKDIADQIIDFYKYDIDTYYLYGSRRAWRMASLSETNKNLEKIFEWSHAYKVKSIQELSDVFQITEEALLRYLPNDYKNLTKLSYASVKIIKNLLCKNNDFINFLISKHREKRNLVKEYLQQSIDFTRDDFAFVELSGTGFTQSCLADIMSEFYENKVITFFFKLDYLIDDSGCKFYTFLPNKKYLSSIIEVLCRAPHGQTIAYSREKNSIVPVLEDSEISNITIQNIQEYISGVRKYVNEYLKLPKVNGKCPINLDIVVEYLCYLMQTPDKLLIEHIGKIPYEVTGRELGGIEYAPVLRNRDIINIFLKRTHESLDTYYTGTLLEYSVQRCSKFQKRLIDFCKKNQFNWIGNCYRFLSGIKSNQEELPYEILGNRVIIYAAGKVGKIYYNQISKKKGIDVVLWVDQNWEKLKADGFPVLAPEMITNTVYDKILIAVESDRLAESIKRYLINMGVKEEKIIYF